MNESETKFNYSLYVKNLVEKMKKNKQTMKIFGNVERESSLDRRNGMMFNFQEEDLSNFNSNNTNESKIKKKVIKR